MIILLLVDEEPLVREGLRMWLERMEDIRVIGEATSGAEAVVLAQALHPDVVLIDIASPIADGLAATVALRASVPQCALVLLSLYDDATMRSRARAAGAASLVGKQEGVMPLLTAIRRAPEQEEQSAPFCAREDIREVKHLE